MAFLNMPAAKTDIMRSDFIAWAQQYIRLPGVVGADLYGARCSILHGGAQSRFVREGRGRPIAVMPEDLAKAFFEGVDRCLLDIASDASRTETAERRLRELRDSLPYR